MKPSCHRRNLLQAVISNVINKEKSGLFPTKVLWEKQILMKILEYALIKNP